MKIRVEKISHFSTRIVQVRKIILNSANGFNLCFHNHIGISMVGYHI